MKLLLILGLFCISLIKFEMGWTFFWMERENEANNILISYTYIPCR
jgi:hypothetical protein